MTLDRRTGRIPTVESSASWSIRRPSLDLDGREYILGECMAMSFECLIDPISPSMFFAEFYEQKPLLIDRRQTSKWASLLSIDEIDLYLSTTTPCRPDVFLVDSVRDLKPDDYSFPDSEPPDRIDLPRAYQLFAAGATISLSQMHERVAPLARLCRAIEKTFSSHSQTNIYLSPPNAQGFKTHFDTHDVFVLQVSGSKQWALYDTEIVLPLRGQAFDPDKHTPGLPTREFTLHAGDLFYCPRGLYHSARSTDETSPKPVSASEITGTSTARARYSPCCTNSVCVTNPTSGTAAKPADSAAPD